ncbi:hypothetical protein LTR94_025012 [Friedmanniomyces endolithicus]|nr:hypothetical protein LTR94_025012 [Friedmanniomyces endolithicus]
MLEASALRLRPRQGQGRVGVIRRRIQGVAPPLLKADYPQIQSITRLMWRGSMIRQGERSVEQSVILADPNFFTVFDLPLAAGDKGAALSDPSSAIGRSLNITIGGVERAYRVTAIIRDLPNDSSLTLPSAIEQPRALAGVLFVATGPSIAAFFLFNRGVELVGSGRASIFFYLMPVFGSLLAVPLLGETLGLGPLFGFALIGAGFLLLLGERRAATLKPN